MHDTDKVHMDMIFIVRFTTKCTSCKSITKKSMTTAKKVSIGQKLFW